jgi:hypothetical protein
MTWRLSGNTNGGMSQPKVGVTQKKAYPPAVKRSSGKSSINGGFDGKTHLQRQIVATFDHRRVQHDKSHPGDLMGYPPVSSAPWLENPSFSSMSRANCKPPAIVRELPSLIWRPDGICYGACHLCNMKVTAGILNRQPTDQLGASWSINAQVWHQKNQHDFDYFDCVMWWAQSAHNFARPGFIWRVSKSHRHWSEDVMYIWLFLAGMKVVTNINYAD